jgi:acyl-CoA synthetase (AMP-forming)/AMP-acid ligase II
MHKPLPLDSATTILECLEHYAKHIPNERAFTFLVNGEEQERVLTYRDLRDRALSYAQHLHEWNLSNKAALLLFPAGLDFIIAFFACAYAGTVAVPANIARNSHHYQRLRQIILNSEAQAVLTTRDLRSSISEGLLGSGVDASRISLFSEPATRASIGIASSTLPEPAQLAFLQYTSGSTGDSKGVMITHGQLMANERAIQRSAHLPEHLVVAGWLPQFHDMGLIGVTLQPIALGGHYVFMSPLHFLQRPLRWLKMIGRYKASTTAAPNFALELCIKALLNEETDTLELSSLTTIFCGAEPVSAQAVALFNRRFAPYGLRNDAVQPCYGLAEATLMVSGGMALEEARSLLVCRDALANGHVKVAQIPSESTQAVVCCGRPVDAHRTIIVEPSTGRILNDGLVGEIWFSGASVASGYWRNPIATAATFNAISACGKGPFMRTDDLGFFYRGGLFVSGRIKELIIFRGRNLYPQDIEATITKALESIGEVQAAVFAISAGETQSVVAYIELPRRAKLGSVDEFLSFTQTLRTLVTQVHEIRLQDLCFLAHGKIPRTSSGKIQRLRCAAMYASDEIISSIHTMFTTKKITNSSQQSITT